MALQKEFNLEDDGIHRRAVVSTVMNIQPQQKEYNFLAIRTTINFSMTNVSQVVCIAITSECIHILYFSILLHSFYT
jgi:hypothetical protein